MRRLLFALLFFSSISNAQLTWVSAYHPTWWYGMYRPNMIDYTKMTHLIIFEAQDALTVAPWFNKRNIDSSPSELTDIIARAHNAGVKVLMSCVGGYPAPNMASVVADNAKCQLFVDSACSYARWRGFDGVEIDWEFPSSADEIGWNRLIRMMRQKLDAWPTRGIMATSMFYDHAPTSHDAPYYVDSMMVFDQINLMSYTMWMGDGHAPFYSGFDTPIDSPHVANYDGWWLNHQNGGPLNFEVAGYPKSKLGIGMSFEGTRFIPNSGWGSQYSSWGFTSTVTDPIGWGYAAIPAANRQYEPHAKANYVYDGSTYWYSFQDTNSVKAIAKWAVDRGWGGLMIYDIGTGWDETAVPHDALLRVAWSAAGATPDTTTEAQATSRKYLLRRR